jgi:hypothetical protein
MAAGRDTIPACGHFWLQGRSPARRANIRSDDSQLIFPNRCCYLFSEKAGHGAWLGAFLDGTLVAHLGFAVLARRPLWSPQPLVQLNGSNRTSYEASYAAAAARTAG